MIASAEQRIASVPKNLGRQTFRFARDNQRHFQANRWVFGRRLGHDDYPAGLPTPKFQACLFAVGVE